MPSKIGSIEFGILPPEVIRKLAVTEITKPDLYDRSGYPVENGVMDPRLGVIDPGMRCRTCGGSVGTCNGHYGYIDLSKPVIHVRYAKMIYKLLRATCEECHKPLATEEEIEEYDDPLYKLYLAKRKECPHCGASQDKIKFDKPHTFRKGGDTITPVEIREWMENISDEDVEKFNLKGGRPEWLVIKQLLVPPVTMRPSITLESGERSEDDLTHKLVDVIRINQRLEDNVDIGAPDFIIDDLWELLQYHVSTFFDNSLSGVPQARHRSGRALRTLTQRLKGKEGRFRGNLSGKRVDFSSRTVISPDPNLSINEVGVPISVAKELTIPVRVNDRNISKLKSRVKKGPNTLSGANYIVRPDGRKKKITDENKEELAEEIENGYKVERHLEDGDPVLFNRQPSLHRMSIMAHKVKVMPWKTFRLNLCVCPPYNADFDGDEMNLHVPQTKEAQTEAEELMLVQEHIRSPRYGGPIVGCIQDHISGLYLLTQEGTTLDKRTAVQLLSQIDVEVEIEEDEISGKELFSYLLPDDLNIKFRPNHYNEDDEWVRVKDGELREGIIDANAVGDGDGQLLAKIEKVYGNERAKDFLNQVSSLAIKYLDMRGFSIGVADNDISKEADQKIENAIEKSKDKTEDLIGDFRSDNIEKLPGQDLRETLETKIMMSLREALNETSEIIESDLKEDNPAVVMALSGARGSLINLTQIAGLVGQETLQGKRINRGYKNRTLSYFQENDLSPKAHGFVQSSFKDGLTPYEFVWDAMNGREGLMDKSLRTRHSGYMYRRLVNALQDLKVEYDGTVRDNRKTMIQFTPAEDGIDPKKSDWGEINIDRIAEDVVGE